MRSALITGAGSEHGIGYACAKRLAADGYSIHIVATSPRIHERAEELRSLGISAQAHICDLTVSSAVAELAHAVGAVSALVNNAGMGSTGSPAIQKPFLELSESEWDQALSVSLKTAFLVTRAFLPAMIERGFGRIVNMASVTGPYVSNIGESAYSSAKAGMVGLTHALALEVARSGVTVNAVAPGWVTTAASTPEEITAAQASPIGRGADPMEIAAAVAFLASAEAGYVNGSVLIVDGANILQERKA